MAIINEVYVGRLPEIEQMIKDVHAIREEYNAKGNISVLKSTKVLEKHIEQLWGFKAFVLDIYISEIPNAYTQCAGSCVNCDLDDVIEYTNKGYRFSPKSNICAISKIATCLLADKSITDEEILAILLHEVGHSFVERSSKISSVLNTFRKSAFIMYILYIFISLLSLNPFDAVVSFKLALTSHTFMKRVFTEITKLAKNIPGLRHIKMTMEEITTAIDTTISNWFTKIGRNNYDTDRYDRVKKQKKDAEDTVRKNKLSQQQAYQRSLERLSDDFANTYGLGPALASGLLKISRPYNYGIYSEMKVTDIQKKIDDCMHETIDAISSHPGNCDRLLAMIDALEQDYKTLKVDEKIKVQMKQDIDALKKLAKDLKKTEGIIKQYHNKYMEQSAKKDIKKNTETKKEKAYNNRADFNRKWQKNKIDID